MWSRRRVLAAGGGLLAAAVAGGWATAADRRPSPVARSTPASGMRASPLADVAAARQAGWTVVSDFGAVGDGMSRPLFTRYRTVADARRDFPTVTDLGGELDGAAIQAAIDSGADGLYYPPGRFLHDTPLVVRDGQRHIGAGAPTVLVNVRRRSSPLDDVQAHSFQIGNIHPAAMVVGDPAQAWAVRRVSPVTAGARSVTLLDPVEPASVGPGDIVMVRSDNPPVRTGNNGVIYEFQMWNRVTAWDPATGVLSLELPVPRTIVGTSGSTTELSGPRLCLNAGSDTFLDAPWGLAQNVEIGFMRLESAGLSSRNGVWRGWFHDLELDAENLVTFNALVGSTVERVSGTWSARMLEIKHSSHDSTVRDVTGTYRAAQGVTVRPAISVGEQSFDCTFDGIDCTIGPTCRQPVRALELYSPGLRFRGTVRHRGVPDAGQVWAIKSNDCPANPPGGIDLDLVVRSGGGFAAYGVIGGGASRPSAPSDVTLRLDQRSDDTPPRVGVAVAAGAAIRVAGIVGDATCADVGAEAVPPSGIDVCT